MIFYRRERLVFLPYLQCCFCENPRGLLQLIDLLYLADHFRVLFIYPFVIFFIVLDIGSRVVVDAPLAPGSVSGMLLDTYLAHS